MTILTSMDDVRSVIQKDLVMIIAKSHTCGACMTIGQALEAHIPNIDVIPQYVVYIDDLDEFRGEHLIFSVPTVLLFDQGKELLRESRYINYQKIERLISLYQ